MKHPAVTELAKYLSVNAIGHSINNRKELDDACTELLNNGLDKKYSNSRNILIVGAGISHNANDKIMLATTFANQLKKDFGRIFKSSEPEKSPLEKQLDYLVRVYNLKRDEFETIMLACSRFDNEKVLRQLKEKYDLKHVPNLFFELVGHMFKHRFIDVIINFNFDEILDNIIEDEMSGCDYYSIISDGDFSDEMSDLMLGHRLKKPIYIKPHGTISHPSTLRFNKAQYFALPSKISQLLKTLFVGSYKEEGSPVENNLKLNLIVAGFGMQSNDLNYILNESFIERNKKSKHAEESEPNCNFFVFDILPKHSNEENSYLSKLQKTTLFDGIEHLFFDKQNKQINEFFNYCVINSNPKKIDTADFNNELNPSLEHYFYQLFIEIKKQFKDPANKTKNNFGVRGIERHLIISELFQHDRNNKAAALKIFQSGTLEPGIKLPFVNKENIEDKSRYMSEYYLLARLYTELALLLVHSNGLINIRQLKESRFNKYFKLFKRFYATNQKRKIYHDITLEDCVKEFGMRDYKSFAKDTFVYDKSSEDDIEKEGEKKYINSIVKQLFIILQNLATKFKSKPDVALAYLNNKKTITEYFQNFYFNYDWQIKPNFNEYNVSKFKGITDESFLHTDLRFTMHRRNFFLEKDKEWNINLSVTKGANWLINENLLSVFEKNNKKNKCIFLIQADFQEKTFKPHESFPYNYNIYQPVLPESDKPASLKSDKPASLHWSLHNQHLHLFLKLSESTYPDYLKLKKQFAKIDYNNIQSLKDINKKLEKLIEVKNGIYYQRRLLSKRANPVYFEVNTSTEKAKQKNNVLAKANLIELLDLFVNYWTRAECNSAHAIENYKKFIDSKIQLFDKFYKNLLIR